MENKTKEFLKKNPSKTEFDISLTEKLAFCDIMDYSNIVLKNWEYFEDIFRSKFEIEKRFIALKDFRNAVKHNRDINLILQKDGEAALEWFSQLLKPIQRINQDQTVKFIKEKKITPPETEEETIARVKTEFVKDAVRAIPKWVEKEFPNGEIYIKKGSAGSHNSIFEGNNLLLFYYYAQNWVYCELQHTTKEELQKIKDKLSKKSSILDRENEIAQVRFHLINNEDLKVMQEIIRKRIKD